MSPIVSFANCSVFPFIQARTLPAASVTTKPFSPWRPGDAYSFSDEWTLDPGLQDLTNIREGKEIRTWDHKSKRWYYHTAPGETTDNITGTVGVGVLIVLLWMYSMYRMWVVWAYTLNFDQATVATPKGWDFVVSWLSQRISNKKRTRKKGFTQGIEDHRVVLENLDIDNSFDEELDSFRPLEPAHIHIDMNECLEVDPSMRQDNQTVETTFGADADTIVGCTGAGNPFVKTRGISLPDPYRERRHYEGFSKRRHSEATCRLSNQNVDTSQHSELVPPNPEPGPSKNQLMSHADLSYSCPPVRRSTEVSILPTRKFPVTSADYQHLHPLDVDEWKEEEVGEETEVKVEDERFTKIKMYDI